MGAAKPVRQHFEFNSDRAFIARRLLPVGGVDSLDDPVILDSEFTDRVPGVHCRSLWGRHARGMLGGHPRTLSADVLRVLSPRLILAAEHGNGADAGCNQSGAVPGAAAEDALVFGSLSISRPVASLGRIDLDHSRNHTGICRWLRRVAVHGRVCLACWRE